MTTNQLPSTAPAPHTGHQYATVSAHTTSEGRVVYQRCACGLWRIQRHTRFAGTFLEATVDHNAASTVPATLRVPVYASI